MIELKNISKKYGDFRAVDNLNLTVARGELFGFLGPNGAGKTTTIKMIAGVMEPSAGTISIGGIDMLKQPEAAKHKIGFIPDRPYLYEKLTAMEFLKFTADLYGVPDEIYRQKARKNLAMFSLADWSDELIESYSHGMKQRLIMSAALLHEPEIIIVDEPMVGLDPAAIIMVKELFQSLARNGVSVFMSTHTLAVAEDVCDRVGIIHHGRLIASGTTADLRREVNVTDADLEKVFLNLTNTAN
jgi:ABC-2 type transport system ATP-binding protein